MSDHIIKAARECGLPISETFGPMVGACPVGDLLERFYALARAEALEDAAKACRPFGKTGAVVAAAIRALMKQDTAIAAGKGEG